MKHCSSPNTVRVYAQQRQGCATDQALSSKLGRVYLLRLFVCVLLRLSVVLVIPMFFRFCNQVSWAICSGHVLTNWRLVDIIRVLDETQCNIFWGFISVVFAFLERHALNTDCTPYHRGCTGGFWPKDWMRKFSDKAQHNKSNWNWAPLRTRFFFMAMTTPREDECVGGLSWCRDERAALCGPHAMHMLSVSRSGRFLVVLAKNYVWKNHLFPLCHRFYSRKRDIRLLPPSNEFLQEV